MNITLDVLDDDEVISLIQEARQEIADSYRIFNLMVEPELIDFAIHRLAAAENRYRYLLRWARERQVRQFAPPGEPNVRRSFPAAVRWGNLFASLVKRLAI